MRLSGVLAALCAVLVLESSAGARTVGDAFATMKLVDLDGRTWTADDLRGRVTLVDFWATWCAPCLTELPFLKRARAQYSREEFEILGVSFDVSDRRTLTSWMNRQGVGWPQVFDGRGRTGPVGRHFGVIGVPTSFLVAADGKLVGMNLRGARLLRAIEAQVRELRSSRLPRAAG
jgi:thiol-disulfide isomerase/thioredoxin